MRILFAALIVFRIVFGESITSVIVSRFWCASVLDGLTYSGFSGKINSSARMCLWASP